MDLILVRHAEAVDIGEQGVTTDSDRMLTPKGEEQAILLGRFFRMVAAPVRFCESSPILRARQTAERICKEMEGMNLSFKSELGMPADIDSIIHGLQDRRNESVMLVGHEPTLGILLQELLTAERGLGIPLSKAAAVVLELGAGYGKLKAHLSQKWLKKIMGVKGK